VTLHALLRTRFCTQTLTRYAYSGRLFTGDPSFSTSATTYPCRVEGKQHLVKGGDGRDVLASMVVYVAPTSTGGIPVIALQDKIVLPDTSVAKLLAVDTLRDLDGVSHLVLHVGHTGHR